MEHVTKKIVENKMCLLMRTVFSHKKDIILW